MVERYAVLVHPPQPSIRSVPSTATRYELYRLPSTTGTSPRRRSSPADHRIVVQSRRRRHVQSATHIQFVSNRTTAVPVLRRMVPIANMADGKPQHRPFICCRNNVATVIQRAAACIDRLSEQPAHRCRPARPASCSCPSLHRRPPPLHVFVVNSRLIVVVARQQSTILDKCCLYVNFMSVIVLHIGSI